jgi:tetratricopeptide (TPR) repeat protein
MSESPRDRACAAVTALIGFALLLLQPFPAAASEEAGGSPATESTPSGRPVADLIREADEAFEAEDYARARGLYEEALQQGGGAVRPLRRLALLQSWDGDLEESLRNYRRAQELAPGDLDIALEIGKVLSWSNDLKEAVQCYEDLRSKYPDDPRVLLGLAQALGWKERYADADAIYRGMEERRIEPIQAHVGRARLLAWQGDLHHAADFYRDVLRADPGNLDARLGMAQVHHWDGLDRSARSQADNLVLDHPESREARQLQQEIRQSLRPSGDLDGYRLSDNDSNRVDSGTAAYVLLAEPQTSVRIAYSTYDAEFRCHALGQCKGDDAAQAQVAGGMPVDTVADDSAQVLMTGLTSRLLGPLLFHARVGVAREESFDGSSRALAIGGGFIRWQVGPRYAVIGSGGREALMDTAPLIDRGLHVDTAELRMEYRFRPSWTLSGSGGYGSYSDGNARKSAGTAIEWRLPVAHPRVVGTFDARYRTFNDDTNSGYFDPLRYDSELLTVAVSDDYRHGRISWRIEGTYGRQAFSTGAGSAAGAGDDDRVSAGYASFGVGLGSRARLEAFYSRSDYALQVVSGFTSSRAGFTFHMRF